MEAAEPEEKLSVERLFYDNLLLLGFEAGALTKKYGASLGADMFRRSNPKAMEIVVYFLLLKIAPEQTKDSFKSVWPAVDRDQQRDFKKLAFEALERLEKDGRIPPNSVRLSHLQTFYLLMWNLSLHALRVVLKREFPDAAVPGIAVDASSSKRAAQIARVLKAQVVMQGDLLLATATRSAAAQAQWRDFAARVQAEQKELSYQLTEVKDMQARVDEELKKLPALDEATQAQRVRDVRATWASLSQQAAAASAAAPTLDQILSRTCNSVRLEAASGERIEPAALAEHWRASLAALQRSAGGVLSVAPATSSLLDEQVRSHDAQLAALRSLNASLGTSLSALQASIATLLAPPASALSAAPSAPSAPLFVPPTPARLPKSTGAAAAHVRPAASRRLQTLPEQANEEERLAQTVHAAAERSVAPSAPPVVASVQPTVASALIAPVTALPQPSRPLAANATASRVAQAPVATKPAVHKAAASAVAKQQTGRAAAAPPVAEKENEADDSLTELADEYVQQVHRAPAAKPVQTQTQAQTQTKPGKAAAAPKSAKAPAATAVWSPAPARSERLASMRARTQALLAASPPPPPQAAPPVATKRVADVPAAPPSVLDEEAAADEGEPVLSDLSLSVLSTALPSPVAGGAPPVFELGSSPPLYEPESLRLDGALPAFRLDAEALALSPLQL